MQQNASTRLIPLFSLFAYLWLAPFAAQCAEEGKAFGPNNVQIHVEHGVMLPWGEPGFRVDVGGWPPGEALTLYAVSPSGETIELIPEKTPLHADKNGRMTIDIDYEREGLTPGHWVFLVAGKPGVHMFQTALPSIEAPTASNPKWRLTFGAGDKDKK